MSAEELRDHIRDIPDFPKPGIVFKDITPLLLDPASLDLTVRLLAEWARPREIDYVLAAEARGFILGAALARELGAGFVPARKPGKLPADTVSAEYVLEYGVIKGENRAGVRYYDETEREIIRAVTELARHGVGGRNLRVFRTSAEREAALLQQILAPALRSRNPERRKEAVEALENLAAVASHLKHLLLVRDLRRIAK